MATRKKPRSTSAEKTPKKKAAKKGGAKKKRSAARGGNSQPQVVVEEALDAMSGDFYRRWRGRVEDWAARRNLSERGVNFLMAVPDMLRLLGGLVADPEVPVSVKVRLGIAVAYVALPFDPLPEIIFGPAGLADDLAVVSWALHGLLNGPKRHVVERHWAGDPRTLETLQRGVGYVVDTVGGKQARSLRRAWRFIRGGELEAESPIAATRPSGGDAGSADPGDSGGGRKRR